MTRITDLPDLRGYAIGSDAPALAVVTQYALATGDLFTFDDDIAQQAGSSVLVGSVRALSSLSRMKDQASQQRAILQAAFLEGQLEPGALDALIAAQAQQATDLASFETSATLGETQVLNDTVAGPLVDQARALEQRAIVLGGSGRALGPVSGALRHWYPDMSYTVDRMRLAERQLANGIALQAKALHRGAMRSVTLTAAAAAVVVIFVLLATLAIARSMVRPLRRLKAGALEVAEARLPAEVRELSTTGDASRGVEVEPIGVHSTDEIGQVARAFDQVHQEAVRLAADEARLRASVSAMFLSLSRRGQSLLERLLRLIDSLELGEQDSERLADLFRMDHLATRMRRNSENLLVLAGQEAPRRWAEPVSLADVARAAVSEIEQYDRVVLNIQPGIGVTGNAVADVVHLLAEVIENATTFSAKGTPVTVSGHSLRSGGVLINVIDSGMGMLEEQLRQVNWRLENPPRRGHRGLPPHGPVRGGTPGGTARHQGPAADRSPRWPHRTRVAAQHRDLTRHRVRAHGWHPHRPGVRSGPGRDADRQVSPGPCRCRPADGAGLRRRTLGGDAGRPRAAGGGVSRSWTRNTSAAPNRHSGGGAAYDRAADGGTARDRVPGGGTARRRATGGGAARCRAGSRAVHARGPAADFRVRGIRLVPCSPPATPARHSPGGGSTPDGVGPEITQR
jgi:signal transduction histidine kinase